MWILLVSSTVANYQTLGTPCPARAFATIEGSSLGSAYCDRNGLRNTGCCVDPCHLLSQFNNANNEHNYVQFLSSRVARILPGWSCRFIIDTGRNGVDGVLRQSCANCKRHCPARVDPHASLHRSHHGPRLAWALTAVSPTPGQPPFLSTCMQGATSEAQG